MWRNVDRWRELVVERRKRGKAKSIKLSDALESLSLDGDRLVFTIHNDQTQAAVKPMELIEALSDFEPEAFEVKKVAAEYRREP